MEIREARGDVPPETRAVFETHGENLGYALLLKPYLDDPREATDAQIEKAAWDTVPMVAPLFWTFRIMVGLGFFFIALTAYFFWKASFSRTPYRRPALWVAALSIPLPWIAAEMGWFVAEYGRQPWSVEGVLPTAVAVSELGATQVLITIIGFAAFYTALLIVEVALMVKFIRKGPYQDVEAVEAWEAERARFFRDGRAGRSGPAAMPAE